MITVAEAEQIILSRTADYGTELAPLAEAPGRVLAEDITADRDLPPCDRVTMDGIAIRFDDFAAGTRNFTIKAVIAAGDAAVDIWAGECVEIMTGAALPESADTVIRYEDVTTKHNRAIVDIETIKKGQNIHPKGKDKQRGDIVIAANQFIDATTISMAASVGRSMLNVKKLPQVAIISTGDELVDITATPTPYQIRHSNNHTIKAVLQGYGVQPDMLHIPDDAARTKEILGTCLQNYNVLILTGGVSAGKFDYVPGALEELGVTQHFHKVKQRPGKPFWFGTHPDGVHVFAFPGNPVSTFLCLHRYFIPWLKASLMPLTLFGTPAQAQKTQGSPSPSLSAILAEDVTFTPQLQYFMQVKLELSDQGQLMATPLQGNGSGDFANLLDTNAFMELPLEQTNFKKGEVYRVWPFKPII